MVIKMNNKLVNLLIEKNYHISFCESCTGGLCASRIVEVPSASKVLNESIVTYSNDAKMKYLSVKESTIEKYGVVSEEVTREMVKGLYLLTNSEVCVSISGIAGPTGGTKDKPVGMVCFGVKIKDDIYTFTNYFGELGRNVVREESVKYIFSKIIELLK